MGTASSKKKHKVAKKEEGKPRNAMLNKNTRINTESGEVEIINEPTSGVFRRLGSYSVSNSDEVATRQSPSPQPCVVTSPSTYIMTSCATTKEDLKKEPKNLIDAIQMKCSPEILKSFIYTKEDVNTLWMQQARPLHLAVRTKQISHIDTLIKSGALVDAVDTHGNTPIMVACKQASYDVIKTLLDAGAKVDVKNSHGEYAIHSSVLGKCAKCIEMLLKHGADINAQDDKGNTALIKACRQVHLDVIDVLLRSNCDVTLLEKNTRRSALHYAAFFCPRDVIERLIDAGADKDSVDNIGDAPFVAAIKGKNAPALEVLLDKGCDVYNVDGLNTTALGLACRVGHVASVQVLLRHQQDPDETTSFGITPLILSVLLSHAEIVRLLLEYGADPNKAGRLGETPIVHVFFKITPQIAETRHQILRHLIRNGANVNHVMQTAGYFALCPAKDNHSILVYAISSGYISMVRMLLLAGANLSYEEIFDWLVAGTIHGCQCIVHSQFQPGEIHDPVVKWFSQIRPLKILCRLAIRQYISPPYPENIEKLPTAKLLRDFVNFGDFDLIMQHRANLRCQEKDESFVVPIQISFLPSDTLNEYDEGDYYQ